ncbi:hypothetical protein M413DRAFT_257752 [Hebeloma cylindrosporum]|uniref:Nephrocystin 3-like N-terminal domain-containing protein n=1 Tax=Hebeloma cylindrosporum TaxID=76867 RepID=A0A0C3BZV6_HEBCY|nr:hypothetical protein M413DRAFT_257752 [Hebeloma cylindrosporum h7]
MSFLTNAQNTLIQDGTFTAVVHGDVHHHSQLTIARRKQKGFEILQLHVAKGAFHDSLERSDPPRCHPRTRRVILEKIMNWISDPDNLKLFLWIYGPAGGGKSAIAQTIAEMCAAAGSLAASFFFSRTVVGRKDFNQLIPTLAYQLALYIPEMREDVSLAVERDPALFSRTLATQIQILILHPLNAAAKDPYKKKTMKERQNVVVLDGLDECGDERSQREVLEVLSAHVKLLALPVLFLITSRPEQQIRVGFSKQELESQTWTISLDETYNPDGDIRVFLEQKFGELKTNHPSGPQLPDQWPPEGDIQHIVGKSSGQFIYAATVMKFMDSHRHPPMKRLKIILGAAAPSNKESPFAELDALYHQLFLAIDDLEGAMDLLTLLILQDRDSYYLTINFSEDLLAYEGGEVLAMLSDMHAFVHVPKPGDPYDAIRIHHASLPDFLFDRSRSGRFFIDSRHGHANVTTHWIKFVQRATPQDPGPRTLVRPRGYDNVIITVERIIEHCTQSHITNDLKKALSTFNLEPHIILYPGSTFTELILHISSLLQWLNLETLDSNDIKRKLYRHYMSHIDRWILYQLSLFPDEMRAQIPAAFIFEDKFSSSPGALFDILSHRCDSTTNTFSKIEYRHENKEFWFICQEFGGTLLFDLFKGFFADHARAGIYFVDTKGYAELASTFLAYLPLA